MSGLTFEDAPLIRAERIELWSDGAMIATAGVVIAGDDWPELIMLDGVPFLRDPGIHPRAWSQVRPYRISGGR